MESEVSDRRATSPGAARSAPDPGRRPHGAPGDRLQRLHPPHGASHHGFVRGHLGHADSDRRPGLDHSRQPRADRPACHPAASSPRVSQRSRGRGSRSPGWIRIGCTSTTRCSTRSAIVTAPAGSEVVLRLEQARFAYMKPFGDVDWVECSPVAGADTVVARIPVRALPSATTTTTTTTALP